MKLVVVSVCSMLGALQPGCGPEPKPEPGPASPQAEGPVAAVPPELGPVPPFQEGCDLLDVHPSCPPAQCGYNTSDLTGFDFQVLNLDGCRNHQRVRLVPGSLRAKGPACAGATHLDIVDGGFVGVAPGSAGAGAGASTCNGAALAGATFWIETRVGAVAETAPQPLRGQYARAEMRVTSVGKATVEGGPTLPSYSFELTGKVLTIADATSTNPDDWTPVSSEHAKHIPDLCAPAEDWLAGWSPSAAPGATAPSANQQALVIAGEGYTSTARADELIPDDARHRWFHIACAGSALAKSRFMGNDPMSPASTRAQRVATLKMLTARYCETRPSYTGPGVPIFMEAKGAADRSALSAAEAKRIGPIEARWDEKGATCISHSRLWHGVSGAILLREAGVFAWCGDLVQAVQTGCVRDDTDDDVNNPVPVGPCPRTSTNPDERWTTYTIDHEHLRPAAPSVNPPPVRTVAPRTPIVAREPLEPPRTSTQPRQPTTPP